MTTFEYVEEQLYRDVYKAALLLESAEHQHLIRGNGHHMALEVAAFAVRRLRESRVDTRVGGVDTSSHPDGYEE